jgi:hypothetical protein
MACGAYPHFRQNSVLKFPAAIPPAAGTSARTMHNARMIPLSVSPAIGLLPRRRRRRGSRNGLGRWRKRALQAWRQLNAAPRPLRIAVFAATALALIVVTNFAYQVVRKPTEMFFPVSGVLAKAPAETWAAYAPLFRAHSTAAVTPELLAALAQVEAAGDPLARTYWRWRLTWNPLAIYRPASSAVGMYQMTDAAFADARSACIRDHAVTEDCWFPGLYSRVLPSHAIELAAVYLDRRAAAILAKQPDAKPTAQQTQDLAALIHLCGPTAAKAFVRRGFRLTPDQRCGDHDAAKYLAQVNAMTRRFQRLAAAP